MAPVFGFLALTALAALVCSPSATVLLASSAFGLLAAVPLLVIIRLVRLGAAVVPRPPVVIGYESALEFWRKTWLAGNGDAGDLLGDPFPDDLLLAGAESPELLAGYPKLQPVANGAAGARRVSELVGLSEPVGLIVESTACRNETEKFRSCVWSPSVWQGLTAQVEDNIYVCAPELAFLQMAARLGFAALLDLAFELCGDYVLLGSKLHAGRHREDMRRLATPERLRAVCALHERVPGIARARIASKYVLPNSWSPMESRMVALLALPRSQGGFGCGNPVLNKRIYLPEDLSVMAGRKYVVPDALYEDAGIAFEYQGSLHDGAGNRRRDDSKSNALLLMGIETIRVWDEQLCSPNDLGEIAAHVRKRRGIRLKTENAKMTTRQARLMADFKALTKRVGK